MHVRQVLLYLPILVPIYETVKSIQYTIDTSTKNYAHLPDITPVVMKRLTNERNVQRADAKMFDYFRGSRGSAESHTDGSGTGTHLSQLTWPDENLSIIVCGLRVTLLWRSVL